jgi:flavin-dependent dehydrogenase
MRYFTDVELDAPDQRTMFWFRDRDVLYAFPNEDGVVAMAAFLHNDHLPAFKADKDAAHYATFEGLPRAPRLREATPISPLIGKLDMPNVMRPAARPGVAFVGDAAQASDPVWGVGIGFAFQSAEWLADEIAGPLLAGGDVDAALERYRRRHVRFMALHHWTMSDYATGRPFNMMDKIIHKGAVRDARTARLVHRMGSREEPLDHVLRPRSIARAALAAVAP